MSTDESSEARKVIATYLLRIGKKRIFSAGVRTVDLVARIFFEELSELGADEEATELYEFYNQNV